MLLLPKRKSTFNFFESFSDLVFCTLVMFLVLVLFLAMNVNQKQEQVAVDQQAVTQTRAQIAETEQELQAELAAVQQRRDDAQAALERELARIDEERRAMLERLELERQQAETEMGLRRAALSAMEEDVRRQRRIYEQALGANRFTGLPARPRMVVAYDWQPNRISVYPVPAWFVDELNTTPPGLDDQQLVRYYAALRERFVALAQEAEPLTPRQYRALIRSVSVGLEPVPRVGEDRGVSLDLEFVVDEQGLPTTTVGVAIPGGNGQEAGVRVGDTLIAIDDREVSPNNLASLVARYAPGDTARLLVQRGGRPTAVDLTFREVRIVELLEAYRTDLSMVISGAVDTDYTYLWEPARADALRERLQQGRAAEVLWQRDNRWDGRVSTDGRPVLGFDFDRASGRVLIGDQSFAIAQFRRVLEALGGGGIVVEYLGRVGPEELPTQVYEQALRPTGFVNRAPQLEKLIQETD